MTAPQPIADNHVHSQWSWDATEGDMEATCRRAVELGLPSVAFTEHADWVRGESAVFDADGYFECIERCRAMFPGLRILTGVELGEPHRYVNEARELLSRPYDRILGSLHTIEWNGRYRDAASKGFLTAHESDAIFRLYLEEMLQLIESDIPFEVLAHLDYPKRYWPEEPAYDLSAYEEPVRMALRALAKRGGALEINTTRGREPARFLCPAPDVLNWWREEGGRAVSFGSDAHRPDDIAKGFALAAEAVEAAGFRPQDDPAAFWVR